MPPRTKAPTREQNLSVVYRVCGLATVRGGGGAPGAAVAWVGDGEGEAAPMMAAADAAGDEELARCRRFMALAASGDVGAVRVTR